MFAYQPFSHRSKQKTPSSLQELKVVSSEETTESVSTHKATESKPITNTVKETKEKTENQTEAQMKVEKDMKDVAVGEKYLILCKL